MNAATHRARAYLAQLPPAVAWQDGHAATFAAARWLAALEPHTRAGDAFAFAGIRTRDGEAVNDLNGFAHAKPSDENEQLLTNLLP